MGAAIKAIEYYLPREVLSNQQLSSEFPEWTMDKIEEKTGILERSIAAKEECSSDLGIEAARKLFASGACRSDEIDFLLLCTQSPDFFLPTTACLMQERLGIPRDAGALDFNLGCSGFIYGLGLAQGLIETGQAKNVLLITAETYSKFMNPGDKSVRTIFGDAAAATLIRELDSGQNPSLPNIGPFIYGTDGRGGDNLIVRNGGMRNPRSGCPATPDNQGNYRSDDNLYMNGSEIFAFTLRVVPNSVSSLLSRAGKRLEDIDLFVFHQANRYMLDHLRKKLNIPEEKFYIALRHCGNTVSSTIPIALKEALEEGKLKAGKIIMLVGFGVGYSWGATLIRWV
ncbi:MAG TPA: ketoacyl-ACP synthase III [Pyrinomonadaceae bacterium]|nr:ketoacyl-ACP synthase III [Pyrinomonadaceae bacterium]